jgi:2',3'-cyclic-nucleotide 2'-phosphodiesterase (5'-nucleotidase family)
VEEVPLTTEKIVIYHTNDMHSHLENWPRIAKELRNRRRDHEAIGETVFAFDIGDACDRVHPLTEATEGQAIIRLLNDGEYDAVTIGNNEGIGSTKDQLNHLYDDAAYDVILSNMYDQRNGNLPHWADSVKIYPTKNGRKIGVFGCTIPLPVSYEPLGWAVTDPFETTQEIIEAFSDEVDCWVMLSHLGLNYDRELAKRFPIDVILGAHTHHVLPEGEAVAGTMLAGAGRYGEWIGQVVISFEEKATHMIEATLIDVKNDVAPTSNEEELTIHYQQIGHQLLQEQVIAKIPHTWEVNWQGESDFVDIGLDAVAAFANTEVAILSAGLFLQPLLEGVVTRDELHQALPHPMRVLKCTVSGEKLLSLIESMEEQREKLRNLPMKGLGFRGEIFGEICYKGISVDNGEVLWNNQPIHVDKEYTFATVDHFLYVPFFKEIQQAKVNEVLFPHFLRVVVGEYLKEQYPIIR